MKLTVAGGLLVTVSLMFPSPAGAAGIPGTTPTTTTASRPEGLDASLCIEIHQGHLEVLDPRLKQFPTDDENRKIITGLSKSSPAGSIRLSQLYLRAVSKGRAALKKAYAKGEHYCVTNGYDFTTIPSLGRMRKGGDPALENLCYRIEADWLSMRSGQGLSTSTIKELTDELHASNAPSVAALVGPIESALAQPNGNQLLAVLILDHQNCNFHGWTYIHVHVPA